MDAIEAVRTNARRLAGGAADLDPLLERIGDARVVLLGEATHGTHEFYAIRAEITKRLIEEKGFTLVAVEADWPDAYRANRYVRGTGDDADADAALAGFRRFPTWMWRNEDVLALVEWLRERNANLRGDVAPAGFYGLDLYSLFGSIEAVLRYLEQVDPEAAERARYRYGCFGHFGEDTQAYGYAAEIGATKPCEDDAVAQVLELRERAAELARRDGRIPEDEHFYAEQNARLVANAERYYRTMFRGRVESWNLRDRHMAETLDALVAYFEGKHPPAKAVVWAHNSHVGDARATHMGEIGELNIGQLARQRFGESAVLVGFTTHTGSVTAASAWDRPPEFKVVRPSLPGSIERLFHETGLQDFYIDLREPELRRALAQERLERAIGVIYLPQSERVSHYFEASLSRQFDAVFHFDSTHAVRPLEPGEVWEAAEQEAPETYPWGV